MLLNMGLSGVPFVGVDTGGFGGDTTAELLVRWYELAIFYPFLRNHCIMNARSQEPWAFSPDVENHIRNLLNWRYKLMPYINSLFWEHSRTGAPVMRPLFWHYGDDQTVLDIDDQFMLGRDIMVAPIVEEGKRSRVVYFPRGRWLSLEESDQGRATSIEQAIEGPAWVQVKAPLGRVHAFVREGSILPLASSAQNADEVMRADITFKVFGCKAHGVFFEEDGVSVAFEKGGFNEWGLEFENGELKIFRVHEGFIAHRKRYYCQSGERIVQVRLTDLAIDR